MDARKGHSFYLEAESHKMETLMIVGKGIPFNFSLAVL
jgi:hypothetical protein